VFLELLHVGTDQHLAQLDKVAVLLVVDLDDTPGSDKLTLMGVAQDPSVFKEVNPAVKQEEERALHEQNSSSPRWRSS
jgi:hypothetical protein